MKTNLIQWRNIASYGDETQEIDLRGEPAFYLLIGKNGAGKSAISTAIKYGWYGKIDNQHSKDIANRINKNGWIRVEGESAGKSVVVERTISPNGIKLWVDGEPYDKARYHGSGPSEYLVNEVLDFPFHVFNNVSTLSINDFKSLLTMGAKDKRDIVDRVLGYHVMNVMKEILSKESKTLRDNVMSAGVRLDQASQQLARQQSALEALQAKLQESRSVETDKLNLQLEQFKQLAEHHQSNVDAHRERRMAIKKQMDAAMLSKSTYEAQVRQAQAKLNTLSADRCPTCGVEMKDSHFHEDARAAIEEELAGLRESMQQIDAQYKEIREESSKLELAAADLTNKGAKISAKLQEINRELEKAKAGNDAQTAEIRRLIETGTAEIEELTVSRSKAEIKMSWVKVLEEAVGENGLKRMAMQRVVPQFNMEIARMMAEMHLDYQVTFDENFDAKVVHLGEEISPGTLSFGEAKKVDFVVLAAWIRLIKLKYPGLNILFLDEIFASVDADGIHSILQILHKMCKDLKFNIFVISHNNLPQEVFDWKIYVDKENGFSKIKISKD